MLGSNEFVCARLQTDGQTPLLSLHSIIQSVTEVYSHFSNRNFKKKYIEFSGTVLVPNSLLDKILLSEYYAKIAYLLHLFVRKDY